MTVDGGTHAVATYPRPSWPMLGYGLPSTFLAISLAFILSFRSFAVFPKYDDAWFFLISYSWLNGMGFTNHWVSPIHSDIFNWHGFMQPLFVAGLAPCGTLVCVEIGLGLLQMLNLAVWAAAVEYIAPRISIRLSLYAIGLVTTLQFSARPELLASIETTLLVLCSLDLTRSGHLRARAVLGGAVTALVALTDPAASVPVGLACLASILGWRMGKVQIHAVALDLLLFALTAAAMALFCLEIVYPYGALRWLQGMREHSRMIASRIDNDGWLKYFLFSRLTPALALMFIPLAWLSVWSVRDAPGGVARACLCLIGVALWADLYWTAIRIPATYYNFSAIVPPVALIAAAWAAKRRQTKLESVLFALPLQAFALAGLLALAIVIVDKSLLLAGRAGQMRDISNTVRTAVAQSKRVTLDTPLIQAVDDLNILKSINLHFFGRPAWPDDTDVLVRAQTEAGQNSAPPPGWVIVKDAFDRQSLSRYIRPESLNYAVYERRS